MSLSPHDREALVELMPTLGPDGDPSEIIAMIRDHTRVSRAFRRCIRRLEAELDCRRTPSQEAELGTAH